MSRPWRMLERFEKKHGDFYDLIDEVCSIDPDTIVIKEIARRKTLEALIVRHNILINMVSGYIMGYTDAITGHNKLLDIVKDPTSVNY